MRDLGDLLGGPPLAQGGEDGEEALPVRGRQPPAQAHGIRHPPLAGGGAAVELQGGEPLHQRLLEGGAHGHHLAHGLHGGAERRGRVRELLEGPAGNLHHRVVEGGLEGGEGLARDVVGDLVERVADGEEGRDLGDGEAGGLGGQGGAPGDPGVHLDHHPLARLRRHGELDVRAAGGDADAADDLEGVVPHVLVLAVREGLLRRHGDRVAGVDAHGVEVLDRADDDGVVRHVAHHLQLELFPAEDGLLDQHPMGGARLEGEGHHLVQLVAVVGDAAPLAAEGEAGADDDRVADVVGDLPRLFQAAGVAALRDLEPHLLHGLFEEEAVLPQAEGVDARAQHLDAVARERPPLVEGDGEVDPRLAADGGEQRVRPLLFQNFLHHLGHQRLDVGGVGKLRVGHDRRRVRVDEDDAVALALQDAAGLGAGVVELAGLTDDDRTRAEDEDGAEIGPSGHGGAEVYTIAPGTLFAIIY